MNTKKIVRSLLVVTIICGYLYLAVSPKRAPQFQNSPADRPLYHGNRQVCLFC